MMSDKCGFMALMWLSALVVAVAGCNRNKTTVSSPQPVPSVRIYVMSTVAGAIEPCGCVKDMLGGVDHAAALINQQKDLQSKRLLVGAGPMFFMDPELLPQKRTQEMWKAEALATSMKDLGLVGWAPGANDFAAGIGQLSKLVNKAGTTAIGANLKNIPFARASRVLEVSGYKIGITGAAVPNSPTHDETDGLFANLTIAGAHTALKSALADLKEKGAHIRIALLALPRGDALRLAERIPGFQLMVIGKPYDRGEKNDDPIPPVIINDTLVVQPPNHLQAISVVDLFVKDDSFDFKDGSGLKADAERAKLKRRKSELERRIKLWEERGVDKRDLEARRQDLTRVTAELKTLGKTEPQPDGSFFRYELVEVRESAGTDQQVQRRLSSYYKRVNEHNREAFKDLKPKPVEEDESRYVGAFMCQGCHSEAVEFWRNTRHAGAYATLERQHKQFNLDCVGCHVTGYEEPGGSTVTAVENLKNVQCEVCHGPSSRHIADPSDPTLIQLSPERTLCASSCHHPPHVKADWSVDEAWPKILGKGHGG